MNAVKIGKKQISLSAILPYASVLLLIVVFGIWSKGSITEKNNLLAIINQAYNIMLIGTGAIFVYSYGGLDFSLGALLGVCSLVITLLVKGGYPIWLAIFAAVALGMLSGFLCGYLSRILQLPIFIVTLSFSYIWSGLTEYGCRNGLMYLPTEFTTAANQWWIKIGVLILFLLVSYYFFNFNRFGKYMKTIGGNSVVAELNGVNVTKYIVLAHVVTGFCVAIAAVFSLARAGSCNATAGSGVQMDVMIGLVLGGVPLTGGVRSKSSAIILGSLVTAILANGLVVCGVNPYLVEGITGIVFIIVVAFSFKRVKGQVLS